MLFIPARPAMRHNLSIQICTTNITLSTYARNLGVVFEFMAVKPNCALQYPEDQALTDRACSTSAFRSYGYDVLGMKALFLKQYPRADKIENATLVFSCVQPFRIFS